MSILTHTPTPSKVFDEEVAELRDDLDRDYSGWFCIETDPWPCPALGCEIAQPYVTAAHLIVVWPAKDDRQLLETAHDAAQHGRNPRVVEWSPERGSCIPYDVWERLGRPVHGMKSRPSDKPFRRL